MPFAGACFAVDCLVVDGWHAFEHKGEVRQTCVHLHPGITRQDMALSFTTVRRFETCPNGV